MIDDKAPEKLRFNQLAETLAAQVSSPEYQAQRLAKVREVNRNAARNLAARAKDRGVPREVSVFEFACDGRIPDYEPSIAFQEAVAWRTVQPCTTGMVATMRIVGGTTGVGKSTGLAWVVANSDRPALFVHASEIAATPKNEWSEHLALWKRWSEIDTLAIDELAMTPEHVDAMMELFNIRWNRGLMTLCGTNFPIDTFLDHYPFDRHERLLSRLENQRSRGLAWFVAVNGPDHRR